MSFIGNRPDSFGYTSTAYDHFNGDGVSSTFTLSRSVTANSDIQVVVNNVIQDPGVAYYVTNLNTLVFTGIPSVGTGNITVVYRQYIMTGLGVGANTVAAQSIAANTIQPYHLASGLFTPIVDTFTANGVTSTFTLSQNAASANVCTVSVNGIIQVPPTNYSIAGKILTFTSVPANNSIVRCSQQSLVSTGTTPLDGSVVSSKLAPNLTLSGTTTLSGNLIVGTSSAMAPLTIAGAFGAANSTFNGGVTALRIGSTGSWSEPRIDLGETAVPTAYIASKNIGNGGGALIFGNRDTSSLTSTLTEKMRIDSSGNVGIGTSSPNEKLTVNGGFRVTGALATWSASSIGVDFYTTARIVSYGANTATAGAITFLGVSSDVSVGGERMRIDSSGNVGIGNASPQFRFEVDQNVVTATPAQVNTPTIYARGYAGSSTIYSGIGFAMHEHTNGYWGSAILSRDDTGSYGSALTFYTSTGSATPTPTERMRIDSSGNVGIGTTSPSVSLDVSSKTDAVGMASGTTAQRPSTPVNGYTRYNTTTNTWETYNNGGWNPLNTRIVTNYQSFTSSGTFTVPTGVRNVQVLVVGGGGGGGYIGGGGGGGGAVMFIPNYQVTPGTNITVTVGAGGAYNQNGGNSQWDTHQIAWGGGAGGSGTDRSFGQPGAPTTGASGGGGSATSSQVGSPAPGSSLGSAGGYALIQTPFPSGGGGGASQCGNAAGAGVCGAGGAGMYFQMFLSYGQSGWFGGGGGGFYPSNTAGAGGLGGGGAGQNNGTSNTGGGGGGYSSTTSNGGSGVVIVAWYQ